MKSEREWRGTGGRAFIRCPTSFKDWVKLGANHNKLNTIRASPQRRSKAVEIDADTLPPFPKRLPHKLKAIRERLRLTPDEIALKVGAKTGEDIWAYENDDNELPVTVLLAYARLAGIPLENIIRR